MLRQISPRLLAPQTGGEGGGREGATRCNSISVLTRSVPRTPHKNLIGNTHTHIHTTVKTKTIHAMERPEASQHKPVSTELQVEHEINLAGL